MTTGLAASASREAVQRRFQLSIDTPLRFFEAQADQISLACLAMARRFNTGGRLLVFGSGASATDAHHVSVEFVHPVIMGKRALPAIALTNDAASLTGILQTHGATQVFATLLTTLARPQDIALGLTSDGQDTSVIVALEAARGLGLLTIGLSGGHSGRMGNLGLDYHFGVPSDDPLVVQETHETLYHILWELVHLFFEHKGLL